MRRLAPIFIATLIAVAAALTPAFLSPSFVRPSRAEALEIIAAAPDYELEVRKAASGGISAPLMGYAAKVSHIRLIDTAPCGDTSEPFECSPIEISWDTEMGRLLVGSWWDAAANLERYRAADRESPPNIIVINRLASPSGKKLLRLQAAASRYRGDAILPSGLNEAEIREHIALRSDLPDGFVMSYSAPWLSGDTAFLTIGSWTREGEGQGKSYARLTPAAVSSSTSASSR